MGSHNLIFIPRWWAIIVLVGTYYLHGLFTGYYPAVEWIHENTFRWHFPLVSLVVSWLLCELYWIFSDRNRHLNTVVICALFASFLLLVHLVAKNQQHVHDGQMVERIKESRIALKQQIARRNREAQKMMQDRMERAKSDRFARYEGQISAETLDTLREIDESMQERLQEKIDAYRQALDEYPTRGPDAWVRFSTLDELETAYANHTALYEKTQALLDFMERYEEMYEEKLEPLDLEPPADRVATAELERILQFWKRSKTLRLRELDAAMLQTALRAINILRESWGNWSYSPRDSRLSFENPETEQRFFQNLEQFKMISREVEKITDAAEGAAGER